MRKDIAANAKRASSHLKALSTGHRDHVCLGLLIGFWIVNNLLWVCQDTTPPRYDDSAYLSVSLRQLAVIRGPWQHIGELMNISVAGRPPLYTLVTQSIYLLMGPSEDVATLATNLLFIVILVVSVYAIGKWLFDSRVGLLAAFLLAGYPPLTVVSRRYVPHFAAVAMIALCAYLLLRTEDFRRTDYVVPFGLATGLGMLTSVYVAFGLLGLAAWFALRSLYLVYAQGKPQDRRKALLKVLRNIGLALAIALALSLPWYLRHAQNMFSQVQWSWQSGLFAPVKDVFSVQGYLWYLLNMHEGTSVFFVAPFVIGVLAAVVRPSVRSATLLWWFASSYLVLSSLAGKTLLYHFIVLLPAVALLSAFWVFELGQKPLRLLLVVPLVLASGCVFLAAGWRLGWTSEELRALGVEAVPPLHENWRQEDILTVVNEDCQGESAPVLVVADLPQFHTEQFTYHALLNSFQGPIFGCRKAKPESLLNARYIIVLLPAGGGMMLADQPDRFGCYPCQTWSALLKSPPESFVATHSLLGTFSLPDKSEARVYKLTRPLSDTEAVELLEEIERQEPLCHEALGTVYLTWGYAKLAVAEYERAIELDPTLASAYWGLGTAYERLRKIEEAIVACQEAIRLSPSNAPFHDTLGRLYREQDRLEESVAEYERAIELDPTLATAHWGLGVTYDRLGRIEEAIAACQEAIRLSPSNAAFHVTLGRLYRQQGRLEEAVAEYERAIELDRTLTSAYRGLGLTYEQLGRIEEAVVIYEEAIRLSPSPAVFHEALGTLYRHQDRLEEAVAEYQRAIELDPARASAHWGLGLTYEQLGRIEEAVAAYKEVLRINPTSERAQDRVEQLSSSSGEDFQHPVWRSLGDVVAFVGYSIHPRSLGAGGTVQITLWWQALAEMDRDYTVFVHVVGEDDRIWTQQDRLLQHNRRPTSMWEVGETVREWYELELSPDTPPGEYVVKVGIYYWETGERLPVWDENGQMVTHDAVLLEPITVTE